MNMPLDDPKVKVDFRLNMAVSGLRMEIQDAMSGLHKSEIDAMDRETLACCIALGQAIDDLGAVTDKHLAEWLD